ncbi:MAG: hypothetical protein JWL82_212 [Parcubacteria group bacterium]|nr:hypothetical protein [Parcubacteria group bacterium]
MKTSQRGFTLIELLVVIAIIGLLSSVALANLNLARLRAADAAVREEAQQFRIIMNNEYSDTGSYTAIKNGDTGWIGGNNHCSYISFGGNYAGSASAVCNRLLQSSGTACGTYCVFFVNTYPDSPDKFTIMAYLPYESAKAGGARYLCYGSSGRTSVSDGTTWSEVGCWANP